MAASPRWVAPEGVASGLSEGWLTRFVKYVPSEVIAAYTALVGAAAVFRSEGVQTGLGFGLLGLLVVLVVLYVFVKLPAGEVRKAHLIVSPVAALAFGYPLAGALLGEYVNGFVVVALQVLAWGLGTFVVPKSTGAFR